MSESPDDSTTETPTEEAPLTLEGFTPEMVGNVLGMEHPDMPAPTEAVEQSEVEETPEVEATDKGDDAPEATPEVESETETKVNFDGFSDDQKTTWERLHEAGSVTPEEVERARLESLRQSDYTKKTMALADDKKAWASDTEKDSEELALLKQIRADDALYSAFLKAHEAAGESTESGEELADENTARKIAQDEFNRLKAAEAAEAAKEQSAYNSKETAVREAIADTMTSLGVTEEVMQSYLETEGALVPEGVNPILTIPPAEWQRRLENRHDKVVATARIAELEGKLSQKTSKGERTSKQSQPPSPQVSESGSMSTLQKTEADLGLDPEWSNVQGWQRPQ